MNHLVIGYGNMGRRHAQILRDMGDTVKAVDINESIPRIGRFDSVLICTPPESHKSITRSVRGAPVFIEKPVSVRPSRLSELSTLSMVACNWRFCTCADWKGHDLIEFGYIAPTQYAYLDIIHFLDVAWEKYGKPDSAALSNRNGVLEFMGDFDGATLECLFDYRANLPYTILNQRTLHSPKPCGMFIKQMKHWRDCVKKGVDSCNPHYLAAYRTNWLIELGERSDLE